MFFRLVTVNKIISFAIFMSLFLTLSLKAEITDLKTMAKLQLAMLSLAEKTSVSVNKKIIDKRKSKSKIRPKARKNNKSGIVYPTNCLKWTAKQINQKAKVHHQPITKYSRLYQVDSTLIKSIITAESCFKVKALSHKGASGLMQLIPATAERFGVTDIYNSEQNIRGGTKYLKFLLARFNGDLEKAIAGYNAGEGAVDKYKGIPPYRETKKYVKNVLKIYRLLTPPKKKKIAPEKPKRIIKKTRSKVKKRVHAVYQPPKLGRKPGRHGWQYNRRLAPHLYKH